LARATTAVAIDFMNTKKSFWPYGIILTFVLFISGTIALIVIACTHKTDLITANYYDDEIQFQKRLDQMNRTAQLSDSVHVAYDIATGQINISLPQTQVAPTTSGRIQLYRPSDTRLDQVVDLQLNQHGSQVVDASALRPGLWKVRVQWTAQDQDYFADRSIVVKRGA
jgi:nitrogen fixation protein FixH